MANYPNGYNRVWVQPSVGGNPPKFDSIIWLIRVPVSTLPSISLPVRRSQAKENHSFNIKYHEEWMVRGRYPGRSLPKLVGFLYARCDEADATLIATSLTSIRS